jgi:hypothetical protein
MALYYHKTSGESVADMISARRGRPYSQLSTAFAYRKAFNPACWCNYRLAAPDTDKQQEVEKPKEQIVKVQRLVTIPVFRPDRGQDPETMATREGDLRLGDSIVIPAKQPQLLARKRRVRVIGDAYVPAQ